MEVSLPRSDLKPDLSGDKLNKKLHPCNCLATPTLGQIAIRQSFQELHDGGS